MKRNPLFMLTVSSLKAYLRNRGAIFFSLLVPLMILAIFGVINFNSAVSVDIGVVDQAQNPVSQTLLTNLRQVKAVKLTPAAWTPNSASSSRGAGRWWSSCR